MKTQCPHCGYIYTNLTKDENGSTAECFLCGNTFKLEELETENTNWRKATGFLSLGCFGFYVIVLSSFSTIDFLVNIALSCLGFSILLAFTCLLFHIEHRVQIKQNNLNVKRRYSK
jgi:hypothetical protein